MDRTYFQSCKSTLWTAASVPVAVLMIIFFLTGAKVEARTLEVEICNETNYDLASALAYFSDGGPTLVINSWHQRKPGQCGVVRLEGSGSRYFFHHSANERGTWGSDMRLCVENEKGAAASSQEISFADTGGDCAGELLRFTQETVEEGTITRLVIQDQNDPFIKVTTGVIQEKCLLSYDDSHQFHKERIILNFNNQTVEITMKKLSHCYKLKVVGPVDVSDIGKSFVDGCIHKALNDNKAVHLLTLAMGIFADLGSSGTSGGSGTVAAVSHYVKAVQERAISCLTDLDQLEDHAKKRIGEAFSSSVRHESHWVYWTL